MRTRHMNATANAVAILSTNRVSEMPS